MRFDFDVAWDAFEDRHGPIPVEARMRKVAKDVGGVEVKMIVYDGPGGGNPNVVAEAETREAAREFLCRVLLGQPLRRCKERDVEDYVEPYITR